MTLFRFYGALEMKCSEALAKTRRIVSLMKEPGGNCSIDRVTLVSAHAETKPGINAFNIWITSQPIHFFPSAHTSSSWTFLSVFLPG